MSDAPSLNNIVDPSTKNSLSPAHLTCDELIELIQNDINEHPKFVALVSTAISKAHTHVHLASIEPLPDVSYDNLRRKILPQVALFLSKE